VDYHVAGAKGTVAAFFGFLRWDCKRVSWGFRTFGHYWVVSEVLTGGCAMPMQRAAGSQFPRLVGGFADGHEDHVLYLMGGCSTVR